MPTTEEQRAWDDPRWVEKNDNPWQARLRRHQAWWRQERLALPPGPIRAGGRLVSSMLPLDVGLAPNLMSAEAVASAERAVDLLRVGDRPGLIQLDRLKRNLLSSQPMCFNLFGHLAATPQALLPWVSAYAPQATAVTDVSLEWAPPDRSWGSAFDAFVTYKRPDGGAGFIGVECKYAEDLANAQRTPAAVKYVDATQAGPWLSSAPALLDKPSIRQFWYNQLLAQRTLESGEFVEGLGMVVALDADAPAREVASIVASQLTDPRSMRFSSIEEVLSSIDTQDTWRQAFTERYVETH